MSASEKCVSKDEFHREITHLKKELDYLKEIMELKIKQEGWKSWILFVLGGICTIEFGVILTLFLK